MLPRNYPPGLELEDRPCPLGCVRNDGLVLSGQDRLHQIPGEFRVVRCRTCGLMRTNPRPTPATIGVYYPDDYGPYAVTPAAGTAPARRARWWERWFGFETRRLPERNSSGRLLEIGCASGTFLREARDQGWDVKGIEFSESAAARARSAGFEVQVSSLEGAAPFSERYDVVAAWMVIEHLHEPVAGLRRIGEWLTDEGYLVASVPVQTLRALRWFGDYSYDLQVPTHLYHFNFIVLKRLLAKAGFRVERVHWQRNPNTLLWTLEYRATELGHSRRARLYRALRESPQFNVPRRLLALILGVTRTSGRIEFWARPIRSSEVS